MSKMLEATRTNAKDAALVAIGVPVVLFDRAAEQLNARLHLDSFVGLAREHAERALDGYHARLQHLVGGVKQIVPVRSAPTPIVDAAPVAPPVATVRAKKSAAGKAGAKKSVRPAGATRR